MATWYFPCPRVHLSTRMRIGLVLVIDGAWLAACGQWTCWPTFVRHISSYGTTSNFLFVWLYVALFDSFRERLRYTSTRLYPTVSLWACVAMTPSPADIYIFLFPLGQIGWFRDDPSLCFKARLSEKPWIWKWFFSPMQINLIFITTVLHLDLALFWK